MIPVIAAAGGGGRRRWRPASPPGDASNSTTGMTNIVNRDYSTFATTADRGTFNTTTRYGTGGSESWDDSPEKDYTTGATPTLSVASCTTLGITACPAGTDTDTIARQVWPVGSQTNVTGARWQTQNISAGTAYGNFDLLTLLSDTYVYFPTATLPSEFQSHKLAMHRTFHADGTRAEPYLQITRNASDNTRSIRMNMQGAGDKNRTGETYWTNGVALPNYNLDVANNLPVQQWVRFRCKFVMDSAYMAGDGIVQVWVNDTLIMDHRDVSIIPSESTGHYWNTYHWTPIVALTGVTTSTVEEEFYVGHDALWGKDTR